jgi:hypothetical protein
VPAGSYVSSIDVDLNNANHLLVTLSNYGIPSILESTNAGSTWTNVEGNVPDVPVRWGMFVPSNALFSGAEAGGILVATEVGVWFTKTTAGSSTAWESQSPGLPSIRVDMLKYRASDNVLAAATHGRGLFTTSLTSLNTSVVNKDDFIQYVSSNRQQVFIKTGNLTTVKNISINLFDVQGRLVLSNRAPYSNVTLNIAGLATGSYILKVYGDNQQTYTKQLVK